MQGVREPCWPIQNSKNMSEGLALGKGWKLRLQRQMPEVWILPEHR